MIGLAHRLMRHRRGHTRVVLLILLAVGFLSLSACVKREIKPDPWNSPRGSVDVKKYEKPADY